MPLMEGTYHGRVVSHGLGKTKTNKEQIGIAFEIDPGDGGPPETITWYGYFTEASIEITNRGLAALGWNPEAEGYRYEDLNTEGDAEGILVGKEADLVLGLEEYEGKTRLKVKFINDPNRAGLAMKERMDSKAASKFGNDIRAMLKMQKGVNTGGAKTSTKPAAGKSGSKPSSKASATPKNAPNAAASGGADEPDTTDIPF